MKIPLGVTAVNFLVRILAPLLFMLSLLVTVGWGAVTNATTPAPPTTVDVLGLSNAQLVFVGVFLGVAARLLFPYLAKAKAAAEASTTAGQAPTKFTFDHRYGIIALFSIVESGILAVLFFTQAPQTAGFIGAFGWAYASQDIFSQFL